MFKIKDPNKRKWMFRACAAFAAGAVLLFALIMLLRGVMNAVSRVDFIAQRLDDYPRLYANYIQETDEWWNWWMTEDYGKRAQQAAFIYNSDETHTEEDKKLDYITRLLGAEKVEIVSKARIQDVLKQNNAEGFSSCFAELGDGRLLVLSFHSSLREDRMAYAEDRDAFLSQLQAGLPGYISVLHDGRLSVYPKDEKEEDIRRMIGGMLESGKLDPAALTERARKDGQKAALKSKLNTGTDGIPAGKYLLYSAAYTDNPDFVISVTEGTTLTRFGRKRSWSLWFLCCAIMVLLVKCLWNTRLYKPGTDPAAERGTASKTGLSAMFVAAFLVFASVFVIQMLSRVNLSQQGATDEAEYLRSVLGRESERAVSITDEFDAMYTSRAATAASVLSLNPQLADVDALHRLDHALGGSGLRVYDLDGVVVASDEILHQAVDESLTEVSPRGAFDAGEEEDGARYYRASLTDEEGKTTGWTELCVGQEQLDELLQDTLLREIVEDLHILDTLHVVVVESDSGLITASTLKNWVGDSAEEHGIQSQYLFDDYEGIISFDGNTCYSSVFAYGSSYVIVGSESTSALIFAGGILLLSVLLILVLLLVVYTPMVKETCRYQKEELLAVPEMTAYGKRSEYPPLPEYLSDFMISVFLLSAVLYVTTKGDPAGLTYNIVRGTWIRGINAATVTTCIMLVSVVFAVQRAADLFLLRLGKFLSPKGMTICRLIDSGLAYIGTIVMIIYALSMFGVNTRTLLNGVGVTALIFTLGANSLIADVVAGLFIIFEGDFTVGDVVVIDDFRGVVKDISMRTTKLMDDNTRDILVVNNSKIGELINQSREKSTVMVDLSIPYSLGLEKGEEILREAIEKLPEQFPKIIGPVEYWGVSQLPEKNSFTGKLGGPKTRIAFNCLEGDREMLTYQVYRALTELVNELNTNPEDQTKKPAESGQDAGETKKQ